MKFIHKPTEATFVQRRSRRDKTSKKEDAHSVS